MGRDRQENNEIPIACELKTPEEKEERLRLWAQLKLVYRDCMEFDNGYLLRFDVSSELVTDTIKLIYMEKSCCPFLDINLELSLSSEDEKSSMALSFTGSHRGAKEFLTSALSHLGFELNKMDNVLIKNNRWVIWGAAGLALTVVCCIAPPLLISLGLISIYWLTIIESNIWVLFLASICVFSFGFYKYKKGRQQSNCGPNC